MFRIVKKHIWFYNEEHHKCECLDYWIVQRRFLFIWWTIKDFHGLEIRFEKEEHAEEYKKYLTNYQKELRNEWFQN